MSTAHNIHPLVMHLSPVSSQHLISCTWMLSYATLCWITGSSEQIGSVCEQIGSEQIGTFEPGEKRNWTRPTGCRRGPLANTQKKV